MYRSSQRTRLSDDSDNLAPLIVIRGSAYPLFDIDIGSIGELNRIVCLSVLSYTRVPTDYLSCVR